MTRSQPSTTALWPDPWWMTIVALGALVLCSCRGPAVGQHTAGQDVLSLPQEAYTGPAAGQEACPGPIVGPPGMEQGVPLPYMAAGPWAPPGISRPWPHDEYIRDGGDRQLSARVGEDWQVHGLDLEDTVAHYDTLDGRTLVEASNRVHIYSPRFGVVRKVAPLVAHQQIRYSSAVYQPEKLFAPTTVQPVAGSKQNTQTQRQIGTKLFGVQGRWQGGGAMSTANKPKAFQDRFAAYENLAVIRTGFFDSAEMARLARGSTAAIGWSQTQSVQAILDHQAAMADSSDQQIESLFVFKAPPGDPKLRVIKVASTQFAKPGDEVSFTIRFDNIGNQPIGNVTIIDNLTTRLEYIAESVQCSLDSEFLTEPNQGDSLVLRVEIKEPLPQGQGGIIRFRCRVR